MALIYEKDNPGAFYSATRPKGGTAGGAGSTLDYGDDSQSFPLSEPMDFDEEYVDTNTGGFSEEPGMSVQPDAPAATVLTPEPKSPRKVKSGKKAAPPKKYALEFWEDWEAPWDTLYLNADRMPGIWELSSGECARQMDHKKTKDKDKAVVKDLGSLPVKLTATGRIISRDDWIEVQRVLPGINPRFNGGMKSPMYIYHPIPALLGISKIYVTRINAPILNDGVLTLVFDMIEWSEPKPTKKVEKPKVPGETDAEFAARVAFDEEQRRLWENARDGKVGSYSEYLGLEYPTYQKDGRKVGPGGAVINAFTGEDTRTPAQGMSSKPVVAAAAPAAAAGHGPPGMDLDLTLPGSH